MSKLRFLNQKLGKRTSRTRELRQRNLEATQRARSRGRPVQQQRPGR